MSNKSKIRYAILNIVTGSLIKGSLTETFICPEKNRNEINGYAYSRDRHKLLTALICSSHYDKHSIFERLRLEKNKDGNNNKYTLTSNVGKNKIIHLSDSKFSEIENYYFTNDKILLGPFGCSELKMVHSFELKIVKVIKKNNLILEILE